MIVRYFGKVDGHPHPFMREVLVEVPPSVGEHLLIEDAHGALRAYAVAARMWIVRNDGQTVCKVRLAQADLDDVPID